MFYLKNTPGRTCKVDGKEFLFFSGYSYLGMNHVPKFRENVKTGIDKYGILFPSSRISNTRLKLYEKFERSLSALTCMEDTVSFSSGFLAGKTIAALLTLHKNIFTSPSTHPAININSPQNSIGENFNEWKINVVYQINTSTENEFVLVADSVDVLKAVVRDFSFVEKIDSSKKIIFLIDDSHGIGVIGKKGEGIISALPQKENIEYIISYSLSKAFNIEGGAVSCSKKWANNLREHHNYSGSTPINPSLIYAYLNSPDLYDLQRKKLIKNINYFKKIQPRFVDIHEYDIPVFICNREMAETIFYKKQIIISSFGYPDPASQKINRIVINALHTKKDLQQLCAK